MGLSSMGISELSGLGGYFLFHIREVVSSNIFSYPFFFCSSFCEPYNSNVVMFNIVPRVSEIVLNSFLLFSLIPLLSIHFCHSVFQSLVHSSISVILLFIPCREFLIPVIVLFVTVCLFFISSRSLLNVLNVSCIFSIPFSIF